MRPLRFALAATICVCGSSFFGLAARHEEVDLAAARKTELLQRIDATQKKKKKKISAQQAQSGVFPLKGATSFYLNGKNNKKFLVNKSFLQKEGTATASGEQQSGRVTSSTKEDLQHSLVSKAFLDAIGTGADDDEDTLLVVPSSSTTSTLGQIEGTSPASRAAGSASFSPSDTACVSTVKKEGTCRLRFSTPFSTAKGNNGATSTSSTSSCLDQMRDSEVGFTCIHPNGEAKKITYGKNSYKQFFTQFVSSSSRTTAQEPHEQDNYTSKLSEVLNDEFDTGNADCAICAPLEDDAKYSRSETTARTPSLSTSPDDDAAKKPATAHLSLLQHDKKSSSSSQHLSRTSSNSLQRQFVLQQEVEILRKRVKDFSTLFSKQLKPVLQSGIMGFKTVTEEKEEEDWGVDMS
ncbi:unnamed protein product [Amoebophrya sp. A120]|nr:unnamed protein product [Amoebophrya sp. A120]|eukprot:GSA120T00020669001.1